MSQTVTFRKRFAFADLPAGWQVRQLSVDWNGAPLLLVQEGKPPEPPRTDSPAQLDAYLTWLNTPPKAHHVLTFDKEGPHTTTFEGSTSVMTFHVQRFGDGWLLGDGRGGQAVVYSATGHRRKVLDLGDASKDVQTTRAGHIWVSYFDEGVYGGGIGSAGLVCFDSSGKPVFQYADLAEQQHLPFIDDCYSLNVVDDHEIWLSYYSDFPLVRLRDFRLDAIWKEFGSIDRGFAVLEGAVIFKRSYNRINHKPDELFKRDVKNGSPAEPLIAADQNGTLIEGPFEVSARGESLCLRTADAFYQMTSSLTTS